MDLLFPHHENELAQSESANGTTFAKYWLHNGLTRINTKKISGSDAATAEGAAILASVAVNKLVEQHGAELLRYLLLSTHYRSPIDFSDEVIESNKKGLAVFARVFERIERLSGHPVAEKQPDLDSQAGALLDGAHAPFAKTILTLKTKFLEMMDDDLNTAGAIGVLHEMAGEVNAFLERSDAEKSKPAEAIAAASAAVQTLRSLGNVLGLFRTKAVPAPAGSQAETLEKVMKFLIKLRADARGAKNFALADAIRDGLTGIGITLEDRPGETGWRKE